MRLDQTRHQADCGVGLHARSMSLCIHDPRGRTLPHQDVPTKPEAFLAVIAPHREGLAMVCK